MGYITMAMAILGLAQAAAPLLERLGTATAVVLSTLAKQLFGDSASTKIVDIFDTAENVVSAIDGDAAMTEKFVKDEYPTVDALLSAFGGLSQLIYGAHNVALDHNIPKGKALKIVDTAHSNVRAKQISAAP